LYRAAGGYVVAIAYRTRWQGELDRDEAHTAARAVDVEKILRDYDPAGHVSGFPAGEHYAEKQRRLLSDIRARYEDQISSLLEKLPSDLEEEKRDSLISNEADRRLVGGTPEAMGYAVAVAAGICRRCTPDLNRGSWNYLADVLNPGPSAWMGYDAWGPGSLIAEVEDADRLDGTGAKWFGNDAEILDRALAGMREESRPLHPQVAAMTEKIRAGGWAGTQAILIAVGWFWAHHEAIDAGKDEWWSVKFREGAKG
jgi:hypothetical protein